MTNMQFLLLWLATGLAMFILARASWQLSFGCAPVTLGTIAGGLIAMWVPPISFIAAVCWTISWLFDEDGNSFGRPVKRFLRTPLFNPCKWARKP